MSSTGIDRLAGAEIIRTLSAEDDFAEIVRGFDGIVHLAGITRVKWGEDDPARCWAENAVLTERLTAACAACAASPKPPWLIYASSREVYGEPNSLPVTDDVSIAPINTYGRSKVAAETAVAASGREGLRTAILRFSTVYGGIADHPDRLFPALMHRALIGAPLMLNGAATILDPTWIDDAVDAILAVVMRLDGGEVPSGPILLSGGTGASLAEIGDCILRETRSSSAIVELAPRVYDTRQFIGHSDRARDWLGWRPQIPLTEGVRRYAARLTL
jgi:UDP-glucose 4-epimerase